MRVLNSLLEMIGQYSFGSIIIDEKEYHSDVIIYPEKLESNWWRKEGHSLVPDDIKEVIKYKPDTFIVGCGISDCMKIPESTRSFIQTNGITLIVQNTHKACNEFNQRLKKNEKVVAALHLTC